MSGATTTERPMRHLDAAAVAAHLPGALLGALAWLGWDFEPGAKEGKPRKVPRYVRGPSAGQRRRGSLGTPADLAGLGTFDEARQLATRHGWAGVGLVPGVPGHSDAFAALDFDGATDGQGVPLPEVAAAVAGTYAELSPSGRGVRALVQRPEGWRRESDNARTPFGFEVFPEPGAFVTITGDVLPEVLVFGHGVAPANAAALALYERRIGGSAAAAEPAGGAVQPVDAGEGDSGRIGALLARIPVEAMGRYENWIRAGAALHHESGGAGWALDLWDERSAQAPGYVSRDELEQRWSGFVRGSRRAGWDSLVALVPDGERDAACAEFIAADFDDETRAGGLAEAMGSAQVRARGLLTLAEFLAMPGPEWRIDNVMPERGLVVMLGLPGAGKSFAAVDLAFALATGRPWLGMPVHAPCPVVYVAAEGAAGVGQRMRAAAAAMGGDSGAVPIFPFIDPINLHARDKGAGLVQAIKTMGVAPGLVVIDTLAAATAGADENAGKDMGAVIERCHLMQRELGCAMLLVHHLGKDATKGARGWSGLKGAADVELLVERLPLKPSHRTITLSKVKDGEDGARIAFTLRPVALGTAARGRPITSCVVEPVPIAEVSAVGRQPGHVGHRLVLDAVHSHLAAKPGAAAVPWPDLIAAATGRMAPPAEGRRDRRRDTVRRAVEALALGKFVTADEGGVRLYADDFADDFADESAGGVSP